MTDDTRPRCDIGPLIGHTDAIHWLNQALKEDRLHHAWRFAGPRGIGKQRLASLFAAAVLGRRADIGFDQTDKSAHLMETGAHPDFMYIARPVDEKGKQKQDIPVDSIRKLTHFFALRPAMGGWRVAIIDSMDELNQSSANALLKTLEEPPEQALLILISHGESPVLPTLKSRCRTLRMSPLSETETRSVLENKGVSASEVSSLSSLALGRPGRILAMMDKTVQDAAGAMRRVLTADVAAKSINAAMARASRSADAFDAAFDVICASVSKEATGSEDAIRAGEWAQLHMDLRALHAEARGLNMDKSQAIASAILQFQKTRRLS